MFSENVVKTEQNKKSKYKSPLNANQNLKYLRTIFSSEIQSLDNAFAKRS